MKNANQVINYFRDFIHSSWQSFSFFIIDIPKDEKEEVINNWLQANWEILVETNLTGINEFLEVYGYGADCNGASSRVCYPDKLPTHRIVCKTSSNQHVIDLISNQMKSIDGTRFDGFMNWDGYYYQMLPPFDYVLLNNKEDTILVRFCDITFDIEKKESKI